MAVAAYYDEFVAVLTYLAVVACAVSGTLEARHRGMDVVGGIAVAFLTAFVGVWVSVILMRVAPDTQRAFLIGTGVVVLLRPLSVRFKLMLPDPRDTGRLSGRAR
jgi:uncharacterized membrane protein YeiH